MPHNLIKLLIDNQKAVRNWSVKNQGAKAEIYIHDVIGGLYGGVDGEELAKQIRSLDANQEITVYINSPGGDVFQARSISSALMQHTGKVTGIIDGIAASAATDIACACDEVQIAAGGFYMIHNAWTLAIGNSDTMLATAELLEKIDASIANIYSEKTKKDKDEIRSMMNAETWMTSEEAEEYGFVDSVITKKAKASNWNLSAYENAPKIEDNSNELEQAMAMRERRLALLERAPA
jgi:ATP-dependent Clp protease protease subunit